MHGPSRSSWRWLGGGAPLLTLLALAPAFVGCGETPAALLEQPVPKVTTTPVIEEETIDYDEYTGRTEASETVDVRARVFGFLKSIDFKDGDYVKEGQTLFTIEDDEYDAIHKQSLSKIAVWKSKLEVAKAELARREGLVKNRAITQEEYEDFFATAREAEAALAAAEADANRTAVDLKYTVVKAPINGRVDRALVSKGELLTGGLGTGTLLTKIVNEQPMYVYFDVDERSLLRYLRQRSETRDTAPGSLREQEVPCFVQLADETDFPHQGKLDFAESEVNSSTGTARIRGIFTNEDRALVSGLFVRVRIPTSESYKALLIPERALATDQDIKYVFVVGSDGVATRRNVELGAQRGDKRIITAGLDAGENVIVKGLQRVRPGQKVDAEVAAAETQVASAAQSTTETKTDSPKPDEPPPAKEEP